MTRKKLIIFNTKLSKQECIHRIATNAEKNTIKANLSTLIDFDKGFFYETDGDDFMLKRVIYYRNSFRPYFHGTFIEQKKGTRIEGQFNMHELVKTFMVIWFGMLAFIGGGIFLASLQELLHIKIIGGTFYGEPWIGIINPFLFLAFGIFIIKLGQFFGKKQEMETIEFIKNILEAKETH